MGKYPSIVSGLTVSVDKSQPFKRSMKPFKIKA